MPESQVKPETLSIEQWVERFKAHYMSTYELTERTWHQHWWYVFKRLPQGERFSPSVLIAVALNTEPKTRNRKQTCQKLQKLADFASVEVNLRQYAGNYSSTKTQRRDIPTDAMIAQWRDRLIREHRRLAHLGDSIMNTAVVDYFFKAYPDNQVGVLHKMGESLKQCNAANAYAQVLGLTQVGMCNIADGDDPASRERLYAELFEALIGALYLDWNRDFTLVRDWFQEVCGEEILNLSNQHDLTS